MASTVEDIVNQALRGLGYKRRIADIYEGSAAARAALEIYRQTRDALLRAQSPGFARAALGLALLKGPPPAGGYTPLTPWSAIYPPPGFLYEYAYPDDMIELRAIVPPPQAMPVLDPRPQNWRIDTDPLPLVANGVAAGPQQKVILANQAAALAIYTRRVTDPGLWDDGFTTVMIEMLALGLRPSLKPDSANQTPPPQNEAAPPARLSAMAAMRHRG